MRGSHAIAFGPIETSNGDGGRAWHRWLVLAMAGLVLAGALSLAEAAPAGAVVGDTTVYPIEVGSGPVALEVGPDGMLWYSARVAPNGGLVGRLDPVTGENETFTHEDLIRPNGLDVDAQGRVWVGLSQMLPTAQYGLASFDLEDGWDFFAPPNPGNVVDVEIAANGDIFTTGSPVYRLSPEGEVLAQTSGGPGGPVSFGPDGNLWGGTINSPQLYRIEPDLTLTQFPTPAPGSITDTAAGPDGNVWFADDNHLGAGGAVGFIDPSTGDATTFAGGDEFGRPHSIAAAGDGNIWFTTTTGPAVPTRITTDGQVTAFRDPATQSSSDLAQDQNGDLWMLHGSEVIRLSVGNDECDREPPAAAFSDTTTGVWYSQGLDWASCHHLMNPFGDGSWRPTGVLRRGPLAQVLHWFADLDGPNPASSFDDVPDGYPFADAVDWAADAGITTGYADGGFHPTATVNRLQLVTFLWRLAGEPEATSTTSFPGVPADAFYHEALDWAVEQGLTAGYSDGTWKPTRAVNRAQLVTILERMASNADAWSAWDGWDLTMWRHNLD